MGPRALRASRSLELAMGTPARGSISTGNPTHPGNPTCRTRTCWHGEQRDSLVGKTKSPCCSPSGQTAHTQSVGQLQTEMLGRERTWPR